MFASSLSFGGYGASQPDSQMEPTQGSPQKGQAESNTLVPVTIHMMEKAAATEAPGGELKVDGRPANMMVVVGAVEDLNKQQASMEFSLNDSTGRMKARYFFPSDLNFDSVQNGTYVSAVGILKTKPAVHFSLLALHPVQSPDQISYHMIEVAHASLRNKGKLPSAKAATASPQQAPVAAVARPMVPNANTAPQPMQTAAVPVPATESTPLKERLQAFLGSQENPEGVAMTALVAQFSAAGSDAVKAAMTELMDDGSAYTTIDDDHFAAV